MREAWDRQDEVPKPPRQKITDMEELMEYRMRKRTEFENSIRQKRYSLNIWLRYAKWEESQHEFERSRSIYERALEVDYKFQGTWIKYAEFEIRNKNVNKARNIYDRAVQLLPRVNQFWFKYVHMEDVLANYAGVRRLYERWMEWEPDAHAWNCYVKWEMRNSEMERAREIYKKYVMCHRNAKTWLKFAKFEERLGDVGRAREVYQQAFDVLDEDLPDIGELFMEFADFEERQKEFERARTIYKFALDRIPKDKARDIFNKFIQFEKQHGDREAIEHIIIGKRRFQYEEMLSEDPTNYDLWFDYIRLEENSGDLAKIREIYERAIANVPPATEKIFWKRYVYLWINYAIFEEVETKDFERASQIYKMIVFKIIPHKKFSFKKLWTMYAYFEVRRKNIDAARKIFGHAIGMTPSDKLFQAYIELEMQLGNIDRCRVLYEKWIQWQPSNCKAWTKFAELELNLQEFERARGILELAIQQQALDMPELIWKFYIDSEIQNGEYEKARGLYNRLLKRTQHVKVWISFAKFEASLGNVKAARDIFSSGFQTLKPAEFTQERVMLIECWRQFEDDYGDEQSQGHVQRNMPKRVKKRRKIQTQDGQDAGFEEYYDYIFPDTKSLRSGMKLLEAAKKWSENAQV
uniref:Suppressor of forked domain-containing protein n=1 Tax=Arcella intermedia TaxID=1963864 RepID=A0A6B2KZN2_9EUKA